MISVALRQLLLMGGYFKPFWVRGTVSFFRKICRMQSEQGLKGVVKHLKVCSVALQQSLGGHVQSDLTSLGVRVSRTSTGIPRLIPPIHRKAIRLGNPIVIRYWLTLFSLYRDILIPAKIKISTITSDGIDISGIRLRMSRFLPRFKRLFVFNSRGDLTPSLDAPKAFSIFTSSPNALPSKGIVSSSPRSVLNATIALKEDKGLRDSLLFFLNSITLPANKLHNLFNWLSSFDFKTDDSRQIRELGRLGLKHEPAGKMRVFAMVDPWTQWALKPLHSFLFRVLRTHQMDGTFNQLAPLSRVPFGSKELSSLDLTAATDRLPISIQQDLLECIFDRSFGENWRNLLVGRDYFLPPSAVSETGLQSVRYAVGQPMGALSSWAMLALTHHFVVQYSA